MAYVPVLCFLVFKTMSLNRDTVSSEQLGHLGLVAATIRELGIIEKIDARLDLNERKGGLVSYGRRVATMVLNGLGFMNSHRSMTTHFFQDKPVAQLLGAEVAAKHLNDDCLRRCLDKIAAYGVTKLYSEIAFEIAREKEILGQRLHLDSTSFVLHGRYDDVDIPEDAPTPTYGYSKANRIHYQIIPIERYAEKGRPKPGAQKEVVGYQIAATFSSCLEKIKLAKQSLGRFILATNQLEMSLLDNHSVLTQYKEQACVESSFKFIKNNAFELDSFYLKTPARISALMMVMTLCLMVYNFAQYTMRQCLEKRDDVLPNQIGKPIKNPTMKWIAELMNMIAVVTITTDEHRHRIVTNVKKVHQRIIIYFGKHALEIYGLPPDLQRVEIDYSNYKNRLHWCER